jgi:hypothetical protein
VRRRWLAALAPLLLAAAPGGCSGDGPKAGDAGSGRPQLTSPARLRSTYTLAGERRSVDALVVPITVIDPWRPELAIAPPGRRWVGIAIRYVDRGADRFPRDWARFEAADAGGRSYPGTVRTPPRRLYAGRSQRGLPLFQTIGFAVPRGTQLTTVRMSSIVKLWPFDVSWRLQAVARPGRVG